MQIEHSEKQPLSIYGMKVYYINPLIAVKEIVLHNEPEYLYEDFSEELQD